MTRTSTSRAARTSRFWAVPVVVASVAAVAACSPVLTTKEYSPSDGVRVDLTADVRGLNLMLVSEGDGAAGTLIGAFANDSTQDVTVGVAPLGGAALEVPVAGGETVYLGTEEGFEAVLGTVDATPGGVLPVTVTSSTGETADVELPVLDGTLPEYEDFLPTAG
ncbi:hypothetical protein [Cellulosimicrobium arenosum]|uniref:DNA modification methylase n=1 Tax=Cellulosimicrobium arenosum TaxID=2708133 RepID=A0A927IZ51_9MICO|nr:hypothetical protein [Cellulosimicrobium arenosum]MBD8079101.1 hypothetical protein [Cellulosimicrobium arenosum]